MVAVKNWTPSASWTFSMDIKSNWVMGFRPTSATEVLKCRVFRNVRMEKNQCIIVLKWNSISQQCWPLDDRKPLQGQCQIADPRLYGHRPTVNDSASPSEKYAAEVYDEKETLTPHPPNDIGGSSQSGATCPISTGKKDHGTVWMHKEGWRCRTKK